MSPSPSLCVLPSPSRKVLAHIIWRLVVCFDVSKKTTKALVVSHHKYFFPCVREYFCSCLIAPDVLASVGMCVLILVVVDNWYQSHDEGGPRFKHACKGGLCLAEIYDAHQEQLCGMGHQDESLPQGVGCVRCNQIEEGNRHTQRSDGPSNHLSRNQQGHPLAVCREGDDKGGLGGAQDHAYGHGACHGSGSSYPHD